MTAEWQQGHDLAFLQMLRALFARYEPYAFGRFSIPSEAEIARSLSQDHVSLIVVDDEVPVGILISREASRDSIRRDFSGRKFRIMKGDQVVEHISWIDEIPDEAVEDLLSIAGNRSIWCEIHTEDRPRIQALQRRGFEAVGSKISASSELLTIMLRSNRPALRLPPPLPAYDQATLTRLSYQFATPEEISTIRDEIAAYSPAWEQHYSSYNERKSWSAISLRGFSPDPQFIVKPAEMSKKWKQENAAMLSAPVVSTPAMEAFPTIRGLLERLGTGENGCQRVRLMRVRAGDGALSRHADITDPEAGASPGSVARLHIPIQSDPSCYFHGWGLDGAEYRQHLPEGSLWYLDTRKPHAVSNIGAPYDRIHLVVDALVTDRLSSWIAEAHGFGVER